MGKSSSYSRRKKRSKASSQARKRKGSKIRSRKDKSKKLRRHFSDEDDSISLTSGSSSYSSSYEDDKYRSKSSRIRTRKDLQSRKKRATRRSYSSESSRDSPHASKRKVSKRKREYEKKTKTYSKKKRRRDYSTSSTSSESTCQSDGSRSRHDVELERHQSKRGKEERVERILGEVESASKRSRYRSRSPSRSHCSESSTYQSEERIWVENNSRRLRSIIIVAERDKEEEDRDLSKDEDKEEIIHIHGEYPSCRSNDSNDVGNKWEEGDHSSQDEVEKVRLENEKGDDTAVSDLGRRKHTESGNVSDDNVGSPFDGSKPSFDECGTTNTVNVDDLESVLRQKALENLRRFRGGLQTRGRTTNPNKSEGDAKQSSVAIAESVQTRSSMEDDTRMVDGNFLKNDVTEVVSTETQSGKGVGVPVTGKDTSDSSQIDKNMTDRNTCENESVFAKQNAARSVHQTANSGNSKDKVSAGISEVQPKLATPASTQQFSESSSTPKKAPEREDPRKNSLLINTSLDEAVAVSAPTVTQNSNNNNNADISNASSSAAFEPSSLISASVETGYDKLQDEAHEGSQFEQKTMSVMRGGEMVKVSYKVYIPKKAPALARRQLKR